MHSLLYLYLSWLIHPSKFISHRLPFTAQPAYPVGNSSKMFECPVLLLAFVPLFLESASLSHDPPPKFFLTCLMTHHRSSFSVGFICHPLWVTSAPHPSPKASGPLTYSVLISQNQQNCVYLSLIWNNIIKNIKKIHISLLKYGIYALGGYMKCF